MSATSGWGIVIPQSEKRTLLYFLILYGLLLLVIIALLAAIYFRFQKELMLSQARPALQEYAAEQIKRLKWLHVNFDRERTYPRSPEFRSAIFDAEGRQIFSTLEHPSVDLERTLYANGSAIYLIEQPESYYLGAQYVVIEIDDTRRWFYDALRQIALFGSGLFLFMLVVGFFLVRLLLTPMRHALALMDRFIKDTTHELNTPVTTILTNVESLQSTFPTKEPRVQKKLDRITVAARAISHLYDDLAYLVFGHISYEESTTLDLSQLLQERLDLFALQMQSRGIELKTDIPSRITLTAHPAKIARLIDNLLSNAIKYNREQGQLIVTLTSHTITMEDQGVGMSESEIKKIFTRYVRFSPHTGGFGLGLSIVKTIADEYGMSIVYDSSPGIGTKVTVTW